MKSTLEKTFDVYSLYEWQSYWLNICPVIKCYWFLSFVYWASFEISIFSIYIRLFSRARHLNVRSRMLGSCRPAFRNFVHKTCGICFRNSTAAHLCSRKRQVLIYKLINKYVHCTTSQGRFTVISVIKLSLMAVQNHENMPFRRSKWAYLWPLRSLKIISKSYVS